MPRTPPDFLVRFPHPPPARGTVGVGFVVGAEHVLTCAHVVNAALGHDQRRQDRPGPDERVTLRLPMSGDAIREARVEAWSPPPRSGTAGGDIAGLVIMGEGLPAGLRPARLSQEPPHGGEVEVFGYPTEVDRPAGAGSPAGCTTRSVTGCCSSIPPRRRLGGHSLATAAPRCWTGRRARWWGCSRPPAPTTGIGTATRSGRRRCARPGTRCSASCRPARTSRSSRSTRRITTSSSAARRTSSACKGPCGAAHSCC
ncbi:MAG: trypsin-like peptidase domain-containing protein [Sciscionella sp.]